MSKKPKTSRPSFFKVLIKDDYTTRLRLPHVFVRRYGKYLTENAKLRTSTSGETWNVKVDEETYDDEKYLCFIGGGWTKFVKDLKLKLGEFLVFWFNVGNSITFDVSVFGTNCCEREISAMAVDSDADDEDFDLSNDCHNNVPGNNTYKTGNKDVEQLQKFKSKEENYESGGDSSGIKSFGAAIKRYRRYFMDIPKAFALETGIATKRAIKLENEEGKEWVVEIHINRDGRTRMSKGWNKFLVENKVVFGSKCWFEFDPTSGNLIMSSSNRGRGRPSDSITVPMKRGRGRPPKSLAIC